MSEDSIDDDQPDDISIEEVDYYKDLVRDPTSKHYIPNLMTHEEIDKEYERVLDAYQVLHKQVAVAMHEYLQLSKSWFYHPTKGVAGRLYRARRELRVLLQKENSLLSEWRVANKHWLAHKRIKDIETGVYARRMEWYSTTVPCNEQLRLHREKLKKEQGNDIEE